MQLNENSPKRSLRNVSVGENVKIYDFVNAYDCFIDDNSKIGTFVEIQKDVKIGKNCKISSHSFICSGVTIGNNVFIGHGVIFTNDKFPRSTNENGDLQTDTDWETIETYVCEGASIGSGSTILPGISIGKNAMIGAGSVVTHSVPDNTVVVGNPAKFLKNI